jgi:hypothetical protein
MKRMKWIGIAAAILMITSCFIEWAVISSKKIVITGVDSTGTTLGKPGYLHLALTFFFIVFNLVPRVWAKRANLLVAALNMAWAVRNYFIVTTCSGGECPEKHSGIYLILVAAFLMLLASLFPDIKLKEEQKP